jgi:hypothetical protein
LFLLREETEVRTAEADLARVAWRTSSYSGNGSNCVEVGVWRTSSYSANGANGVEVGAWATSSHSGNGSDCVKVGARAASSRLQASGSRVEVMAVADGEAPVSGGTADAGQVILVRDSKDRGGGMLAVDEHAWQAFIAGIKDGKFSLA